MPGKSVWALSGSQGSPRFCEARKTRRAMVPNRELKKDVIEVAGLSGDSKIHIFRNQGSMGRVF